MNTSISAMPSFSIGDAFKFAFTTCAPELLKSCAIYGRNHDLSNLAQDIIFSRNIVNIAFGSTIGMGLVYMCARQINSVPVKKFTGTAFVVSAVVLGLSGSMLIDSVRALHEISDRWNALYPRLNFATILDVAKKLRSETC